MNQGAAAGFWTEVTLRIPVADVDAAADLLAQVTGASTSVDLPIEPLEPEEGYLLDESALAAVHGYLPGAVSPSRRRAVHRALTKAGMRPTGSLRWRTIAEEDWAEAWKDYFQIEKVGRVVVRPAWREYQPLPNEVVVSLDPGAAFGTGQHPTTRMCLAVLQSLIEPGCRVLDVGTGSGILSIAALGLGAKECVAVDIEAQAVASARANAALNGLEEHIQVIEGSLQEAAEGGPYDLVLANISAATIRALAPGLKAALTPGGVLVAGGIIEGREAECRLAIRRAGFIIRSVMTEGEWRTLVAEAQPEPQALRDS